MPNGHRPGRRDPTPAYLSTAEQILTAFVVVTSLVATILPWQLGLSGHALWLPVIVGVVAFCATWALVIRTVLDRTRDSAATPAADVSRRRHRIAFAALIVGVIAISARLLLFS
jgi:4-hydroxybenzoate polyprenyltransferase